MVFFLVSVHHGRCDRPLSLRLAERKLESCPGVSSGALAIDVLFLQDVSSNYATFWDETDLLSHEAFSQFFSMVRTKLPDFRLGFGTFSSSFQECFTLITPLTSDVNALLKGAERISTALEETRELTCFPDANSKTSNGMLAALASVASANVDKVGWIVNSQSDSDETRKDLKLAKQRLSLILVVTDRPLTLGSDTATTQADPLSFAGALSFRNSDVSHASCMANYPSWSTAADVLASRGVAVGFFTPERPPLPVCNDTTGLRKQNVLQSYFELTRLTSEAAQVKQSISRNYNTMAWHLEKHHGPNMFESIAAVLNMLVPDVLQGNPGAPEVPVITPKKQSDGAVTAGSGKSGLPKKNDAVPSVAAGDKENDNRVATAENGKRDGGVARSPEDENNVGSSVVTEDDKQGGKEKPGNVKQPDSQLPTTRSDQEINSESNVGVPPRSPVNPSDPQPSVLSEANGKSTDNNKFKETGTGVKKDSAVDNSKQSVNGKDKNTSTSRRCGKMAQCCSFSL